MMKSSFTFLKSSFAFALLLLGLACLAAVLVKREPTSSMAAVAAAEPATGASIGAAGERVPVIVELFTSEGCSSCPPADAALAMFEQAQPVSGAEVIALSEHVDYWNRLGWADPYSHAGFSQRQYTYAQAFKRDGVYTPQMIVDGQTEFPGGNRELARQAITRSAQAPKAIIEVERLPANTATKTAGTVPLHVRVGKLPAVTAGDTAEVILAVTESRLATDVPRGENAGRRLSHPSVVRWLTPIGVADAEAETAFAAEHGVKIERGWRERNLQIVLFVQERGSRKILGARAIKLVPATKQKTG